MVKVSSGPGRGAPALQLGARCCRSSSQVRPACAEPAELTDPAGWPPGERGPGRRPAPPRCGPAASGFSSLASPSMWIRYRSAPVSSRGSSFSSWAASSTKTARAPEFADDVGALVGGAGGVDGHRGRARPAGCRRRHSIHSKRVWASRPTRSRGRMPSAARPAATSRRLRVGLLPGDVLPGAADLVPVGQRVAALGDAVGPGLVGAAKGQDVRGSRRCTRSFIGLSASMARNAAVVRRRRARTRSPDYRVASSTCATAIVPAAFSHVRFLVVDLAGRRLLPSGRRGRGSTSSLMRLARGICPTY